MSPKTPRDVSATDLIKVLAKYGYTSVRQTGSHIRMAVNTKDGTKKITIPNHDPIKLGTLSSILNDVSDQLNIEKDEIVSKL